MRARRRRDAWLPLERREALTAIERDAGAVQDAVVHGRRGRAGDVARRAAPVHL